MATSRSSPKRAAPAAPDESAPDQDQVPDFEAAIGELDTLVEQLEGGELSLREALDGYARGVRLARDCQRALDAAERRVVLLNGDDVEPIADPGSAPAQ